MSLNRFDHIAGFQELIKNRVSNILLVASLYDAFILAQDGQLQDLMTSEFANLNLYHAPKLTRVSRGGKALKMIQHGERPDLIILTTNLGDRKVDDFAFELRAMGIHVPIVLLSYDTRAIAHLQSTEGGKMIDHMFVWQGDFRILLAIVKLVEDRLNVQHDANIMGVQTVILVEDSIRFYSSYLPIIYTEIVRQAQRLLDEGLNLAHKMIRMRARPKILLCKTYEEAIHAYHAHQEHLLGIITDLEFPRAGESDPIAGVRLIREVRKCCPELPVLLQSNQERVHQLADEMRVSSADKRSPKLLKELRHFMRENFGFGDFIFRLPDGTAIGRARDLHSLEKQLLSVNEESLRYHAEHGHFSKWLKARTEFGLARILAKERASDYPDTESIRHYLIHTLRDYRQDRTRGIVSEFSPGSFDSSNSLAQIGKGSMGGKARGLSFVRHMISLAELRHHWEGVRVSIPPAVVLCTEVFDQFMELNDLSEFAMDCNDDDQIQERFLESIFPPLFQIDLQQLVSLMDYPLAVRSSSLLEDSQYQPFAGIYRTVMVPNNSDDPSVRLRELVDAIKLVYASTYKQEAKAYIHSTPYRTEEEKMAVVIQRLVGSRHQDCYYPIVSGTARSYNFYPVEPASAEDGVASIALGLGHLVAEGSQTMRFCPSYPKHASMFTNAREALQYSQKHFYALSLSHAAVIGDDEGCELEDLDMERSEEHGSLALVGSVYSVENDMIYDSLSRPGVRFASFAPILKHDAFPLADILARVLRIGSHGMGRPVEVEFATNLLPETGELRELNILQMRPMVLSQEVEELDLDETPERRICSSSQVLGAGRIEEIYDLVVVDINKFERKNSREVARQVSDINARLVREDRGYVLIGVGRWGSSDPWLGIPVKWDHISGARVIVEAGFRDLVVTPSQGSHFFQNMTSLGIGYFTVNPDKGEGMLDWDWMMRQTAEEESEFVRLIRMPRPYTILMNGRKQEGVILRPDRA
jgi:CheY-like chemotaxis protein